MAGRRHGACGWQGHLLCAAGLLISVSATASAQTIVQQAQLLPNGSADDRFGSGLAIDGTTLIVGASFDSVGSNAYQGSAYVYVLVEGVWVLQAHLFASDGVASDQFGISVAIDGDTAIVGAPYDDVGVNEDQGSAYVFVRAGDVWTLQQRLSVAGNAADRFGWSVAVSGDRVLVGAPADDVGANVDQGTAFSFTRSHGVWTPEFSFKGGGAREFNGYAVALLGTVAAIGAPRATANAHVEQGLVRTYAYVSGGWSPAVPVTPAAGAAGDWFGVSVALDGKSLIAGASRKEVSAHARQGAAFLFVAGVAGWTEQATLVASDGAADDCLGEAVAIDGDSALVGASWHNPSGVDDEGSAYVFTRSGSTWTQRARLNAPGGAASDLFGQAVALGRGAAAVGAPVDDAGKARDQGSVTVFTGSGATWTPKAWLSGYGPEQAPWFGDSVAVSGDTLAVGAPKDTLTSETGGVYVFVRSGLVWTLQAHFAGDDSTVADYFGASVALAGDTLVVGAPWHDVVGTGDGAAYVFTRSSGTWTQQAKLVADDAGSLDNFGEHVAISLSTIVVSASGWDAPSFENAGAAYVFEKPGATWPQSGKLTAPDAAADAFLGSSVAVDGTTVVIGARRRDAAGVGDVGAAYVFTKRASGWTWQATLLPPVVEESSRCGQAVAVQGHTALVGCPGATVGTAEDAGAITVFTRAGTAWAWTQSLTATNPQRQEWLGRALAFEGDTAVAGATGTSSARGAVYAFTRVDGTWREVQRLQTAGGRASDGGGWAVGLSGDLAVGSSPGTPVAGLDLSGAAAVFSGLCQFAISPPTIAPGAGSTTRIVTVNAGQSSCAWSTTSQAAWLTFVPPGTGTGDGAVTVQVAANTGPARTGTMTIAEQTFTVNQASGCSFTLAADGRRRRAPAGARARSASRPPTPPAPGRLQATSGGCRWSRPRAAPAAVRPPTRCCPTRGPPAWARSPSAAGRSR